MNYFVYIKDILGLSTNAENFSWCYGCVAPKTTEAEFNQCMVKINLSVRKTADVFDESLNLENLDRYNHFYAKPQSQKVYYERSYLLNAKHRYSIEVLGNEVNVIVDSNYYKYVRYRFMNVHSLGYILTDLVSGILLMNGYATLHCSSISIGDKALVIFAPPSTGKTLTALRLCEYSGAKYIAEDIAITDGEFIYAVPWTSTFRCYNHSKESKTDRFMDTLRKKVPVFQLVPIKKRKSIHAYLNNDFLVDSAEISDAILLGKGKLEVMRSDKGFLENIMNLSKYELNYYRSPTMLVMNYFNPDFSLDQMYEAEKLILGKLVANNPGYRVNAQNALDYSKLIIEQIIEKA
ncbi:MAG: hypothetical protein WBI17_12605 [Clostridiaceae bacterium]